MKDYLLLGFIAVMAVLYLVILPLVKRQKLKERQTQLEAFQESLCLDDRVMLAAGILGTIKVIQPETIQLEIAKQTIIEVDRMAIVGKISN